MVGTVSVATSDGWSSCGVNGVVGETVHSFAGVELACSEVGNYVLGGSPDSTVWLGRVECGVLLDDSAEVTG